MPLQRISLKNFQVHGSLTLELSPTITVLLGPTDVGKSSVIRALKWLTTNRPAGMAFLRTGEEEVKVEVEDDKKNIMARRRSASVNAYEINGRTLEAFRSDVPEDVQHILALGDVNFQDQRDLPFWFSESAGEVSRRLNEIVDLGAIDGILAWLKNEHTRCRAEQSVVQERLAKLDEERRKLRHVRQLDADFRRLKRFERKASSAALLRAGLASAVETSHAQGHWLKSLRQLQKDASVTRDQGSCWRNCRNMVEALNEVTSELQTLSHLAQQPLPDTAPLEQLARGWGVSRKRTRELGRLMHEMRERAAGTIHLREQAKQAQTKLEAKMGKVCPLCGKSLQ